MIEAALLPGVWTPEQRALVLPSRALPDRQIDVDGTVDGKTAAQWFERVHRRWTARSRSLQLQRTGLPQTAPALLGIATAVLERVDAPPTMPTAPLDVDVEAASICMDRNAIGDAVPWWWAKEGPAFTVRAFARCYDFSDYGRTHFYDDEVGTWLLEGQDDAWSRPEYADGAWRFLRARLALLDDEAFATAAAAASAVAPSAALPARAGLALAFNDRRAADAVVAALEPVIAPTRARQKKHYTAFMARLVSVASADAATALLRWPNDALKPEDLLTLVAHDGVAALPVVVAAFEYAVNNDQRLAAARALLPLDHPEVAALLTTWSTEKKPIAAVLKKHRTLHPALY